MIETREVRKRLDPESPAAASPHTHYARVLLGMLKKRMEVLDLPQGWDRKVLADGTEIKVASRFGQDEVEINVPPTPLTAEPAKKAEEEKEEQYYPYLFVGARIVSGARGWLTGSTCIDKYGCANLKEGFRELCPRIMLTAWEPFDPDSDASIVGTVVSNRAWYIDEIFDSAVGWRVPTEEEYPLQNPRALRIGDDIEYQTFDEDWNPDRPFEDKWAPDQPVVQHTDNNLYQLGAPITWDPRRDLDDPDAKLWEQVIVLDPQDPLKHWTQTFPYHTALGDVERFPINNAVEWSLPGKVLGGMYTIKFMMFGPMCPNEGGYPDPATVELEVRLGKPPGRFMTKTFRITVSKYHLLERAITPYGFYGSWKPEWNGANLHDQEWMQGAIRVDVHNGTLSIKQPGDEKAIPRGFAPGAYDNGCIDYTCNPACTEWVTDVVLDFKIRFFVERRERFPGDPAYLLSGFYIGPYDYRATLDISGGACTSMSLLDADSGLTFTYLGYAGLYGEPTGWVQEEQLPAGANALGTGYHEYWAGLLLPVGPPENQLWYPPEYACYEDYQIFCYGDPCLQIHGSCDNCIPDY